MNRDVRGAAGSLWARLPRELVVVVRPRIPRLAEACVDRIAAEVPEYADLAVGEARFSAVETARLSIERDMDQAGVPEVLQANRLAEFRGYGKDAYDSGRSRDAAQAALRVSSRVFWRQLASAGRDLELSTESLYNMAEAMFFYVEEASAAVVEGYSAAESGAGGEGERRLKLLRLLIAGNARGRAEAERLAAFMGWTMPGKVSVVALRALPGVPDFPAQLLPERVLTDLAGDRPYLLTGDPDADLAAFRTQPTGWSAAVGPPVPIAQAGESFRVAERALELSARGLLDMPGPLLWCREHLATLMLLSDEFLLSQLIEQALEPFAGVSGKRREHLAATLLVLLQTRGSAPEIGRLLDVHPQTVRARLRQLGELFGGRLDDSTERLKLELALRAEQILPATVG